MKHHYLSNKEQLLATRGMDEGYLVTFDFSKQSHKTEPHRMDIDGKHIFEAVI